MNSRIADTFTDSLARLTPMPWNAAAASGASQVREPWIFDLHGRVVADLGAAALPEGAHQIAWDGRASDGRPVEAGVYFLRVEGPGIAVSRSVVRLK